MALRINKPKIADVAKATVGPALDDPQEAVRLLTEVFRADPANEAVFAQLEGMLREQKQLDVLQDVLIARVSSMLDPAALNRLGVMLFEAGNRKQAIRCFEVALKYGETRAKENLRAVSGAKANPREKALFNPEIERVLKTYTPKLSVCMIVKNEERFLGECLESLKGAVDEIIVVDTGSEDQTVKIARKHGAKVYPFPWTGDFSAARNESLKHATGDWVLVIDADERLDAESKEALRRAIAEPKASSYFIELTNDLGDGKTNVVLLPRLFRMAPGVHYTGLVHEQVVPQLEALGYRHVSLPVKLWHEGYREDVYAERDKAARNLELLERQHGETPDDHYTTYQLGKQLFLGGQEPERTIDLLEAACRGIEAMSEVPSHGPDYFKVLMVAYRMAKQPDKTVQVATRGLKLYPDFLDLHYHLGLALLDLGSYGEAVRELQSCRSLKPQRSYSCESDPAIPVWKSLWGEGVCRLRQGQTEIAIRLLEGAREKADRTPRELTADLAQAHLDHGNPELALAQYYSHPIDELQATDWLRMARASFRMGRYAEALSTLERLGSGELQAEAETLKGECLLWLGRLDEARAAFERALQTLPSSEAAQEGLSACQLLAGARRSLPLQAAGMSHPLNVLAGLREDANLSYELTPAMLSTWSLLLRHGLAADRLELAELLLEQAMRLATDRPEMARSFAAVLLPFGAGALALELLEASLEASGQNLDHLHLIAQAAEASGNPVIAREAYQACLALKPTFAPAKEALGRLNG